MAYAFVQNTLYSGGAVATITLPSITVGAGNRLLCTFMPGLAPTSITWSDVQGDVFTPLVDTTSTGSTTKMYGFVVNSAIGGATVITLTTVGGTFGRVLVQEFSGVSGALIGTNFSWQNGAGGPSANSVTAGPVNATAQPAMIWGFTLNSSFSDPTITAGTSPIVFTPRTVWSAGAGDVDHCLAEDARLTATGNASVTFGNSVNNQYLTIMAIFAEVASGGGGGADTGPLTRGVTSPVTQRLTGLPV